MPAITSTSTRMHGEFLRLLFLQAHRETAACQTAGHKHLHAHARRVPSPSLPPGSSGDCGLLHLHGCASATNPNGHVPFPPRGILLSVEEQGRPCGRQSRCPSRQHGSRQLHGRLARGVPTHSLTRTRTLPFLTHSHPPPPSRCVGRTLKHTLQWSLPPHSTSHRFTRISRSSPSLSSSCE